MPSSPSSKKEKGKKPGKPQKNSSEKNNRFVSVIIFIFAFLLYANTLNHGYVLDDDVVYLKNKDVQAGFGGIKSILNHSFIYGFTGHNDQSYRPVVLVIFAIEKQIFGNNPRAGHFINVLLFALSCVLLFHLLKKLFKAHPWGESLAVVAALIFASHPIHTEAVANIKGRDEILTFLFLLLSLFTILKYIDAKTKKHLIYSVLFFFLALLCKEMAVTFLAIIPLTILFFRDVSIKEIALLSLPFIAVFGIYMLIRSSVLETVTFAEKMKVVNNALAAATNESDRIATAIFILGKYILLLFFPHPLSWDYSYNQIPIVSFSDIKVIVTLCVFAALGVYSSISLVRLIKDTVSGIRYQVAGVFAYCILFFFISMSVVSNIFIMIGSTLGERFLFTPSLAFCVAVAIALKPSTPHLNELRSQPTVVRRGGLAHAIFSPFGGDWRGGLVLIILILFSFKTYTRNKDWKDNISLFTAGVEATPNSSRAESALGSSYREMGEKEPDPGKRAAYFKKAIEYYTKAIEILPDNTEALYNAGVAYYGIGDKENALKMYEKNLKITPEQAGAANNTGVIYFERQEYDKAKKYFLQAIQYDSNNADALGNLGAINHNTGNLPEAIHYYKKALQINPANQNVQGNLMKAENALKQRGGN